MTKINFNPQVVFILILLRSDGVLEQWSNGQKLQIFINTPKLHHSSTPRPRSTATLN
jgi:hypothetical protein